MKLQTYLNLSLMAAIVAICLLHNLIWPCGNKVASQGNPVTVLQETETDSTPSFVLATPVKPKRITPALQTAPRRTAPEMVPQENASWQVLELPELQRPYFQIDSSGFSAWFDFWRSDSIFINGKYYVPFTDVLQYHATAEYDTTVNDTATDIRLTAFNSVRGNRLVKQQFMLQNNRATSNLSISNAYEDRFQFYLGGKFSVGGTRAMGAAMLGAGAELSFKTKDNLLVDVGFVPMITTDATPQLFYMGNIDIKPLVRFTKWGNAIRNRRLKRQAAKELLNLK